MCNISEKYDLLKQIGFSDEYIKHIKKSDEKDDYVFEYIEENNMTYSNDVTNMIIYNTPNNIRTNLLVHSC